MPGKADSPDILCFGSADFEEPNWVNAQHLMWRLSARHRVLYVNSLGLRSPRADRRDLRKIARRLRALGRGPRRPDAQRELYVLSPLSLPPARGRLRARLGRDLLALQVRAALRRLGCARPAAWVFLPSAAPVLARLPLGPVIYHCVDAYEANPGVDAALVASLETALLARARLVVAASAPLAARLSRHHSDVRLMPNVVDIAAFPPPGGGGAEPPELAGIPRPRIGYVGNLAGYKVDLALLAQAARERPRFAWCFIGEVGQGEGATPLGDLARLPNVYLLGPQPRDRLGAFLHHLDVGLIPFVASPSTRHAFPLKFFEYLACGLPVVSAPLPGLAGLLEPPLAFTYDDLVGFLDALEQARAAGGPAAAGRRRRVAEDHSWERRIDEIETLLGELSAAGVSPLQPGCTPHNRSGR